MPLRAICTIARTTLSRQSPCRARRKASLTPFRTFTLSSARQAKRFHRDEDLDEDNDEDLIIDGDRPKSDEDIELEKLVVDRAKMLDELISANPRFTANQKAILEGMKTAQLSNKDIHETFERLSDYEDDELYAEELEEPPRRIKEGFLAMDEEPEDQIEDPEFQQDDISTLAHAELEQHREMREFARVIAWDMPLLWNHIKPFKAPERSQPLRFRYTTYLGETHPASRKVVMEFSPTQVGELKAYSDVQTAKLVKLLGVRFNPETGIAKMSCEMFPTTPQNKRYLGDLLQKLLKEVEEGKDTFEDVPFDFRHHQFKPKLKFPEEWKMTESRRAELEAKRRETQFAEQGKAAAGKIVDGHAVISNMLAKPLHADLDPVTVPAFSTRRIRR